MKCCTFMKRNEDTFKALMEELLSHHDVELAYSTFMNIFTTICFPLVQIKRKCKFKNSKPLITPGPLL